MKESKNNYESSCYNAEKMLRIINNDVAKAIIASIWNEEKYVQKIMEEIDKDQSQTSVHLRKLLKLGLLKRTQIGKYAYYRVDKMVFAKLDALAKQLTTIK